MFDRRLDGVPVREVPRQKICRVLDDLRSGIEINNNSGDPDIRFWITLRFEIEFVIRALTGETH